MAGAYCIPCLFFPDFQKNFYISKFLFPNFDFFQISKYSQNFRQISKLYPKFLHFFPNFSFFLPNWYNFHYSHEFSSGFSSESKFQFFFLNFKLFQISEICLTFQIFPKFLNFFQISFYKFSIVQMSE